MFRRLRNKLILINLGITSVVIAVVFTAIYMLSTRAAKERPPLPERVDSLIVEENGEEYTTEMKQIITYTVREEKQAAARDLLVALVVSGFAIELAVFFVSYFLAEAAVRPVREAYEAQKVFIANASHEIKTPLAAIAANLEAADIKGNRWLKNVEAETARLAALNTELLTLARTDLVQGVTTEDTDMKELVKRVLDPLEPRLLGLHFVKKITVEKKLKINAGDLAQIMNILLDNAIKYSAHEIKLTVSVHELVVSNDGKTIDEESLLRVFDRFYQVDKTSEGVGLGLSIAKSLAERNGWQLTAESDGGMTRFKLNY